MEGETFPTEIPHLEEENADKYQVEEYENEENEEEDLEEGEEEDWEEENEDEDTKTSQILNEITNDEFKSEAPRTFGTKNPELMQNKVWKAILKYKLSAYKAKHSFGIEYLWDAVWCFERFGRSKTKLPDGRIIKIAGEHEDFYDPDFCIYNDVTVFQPNGEFEIYGYPVDVFPCTDFHSATLVDSRIIIIGSLGYKEERKENGPTSVFALDLNDYSITRLNTTGDDPKWIFKHKAVYQPDTNSIEVSGGDIYAAGNIEPNPSTFLLDLNSLQWTKQ